MKKLFFVVIIFWMCFFLPGRTLADTSTGFGKIKVVVSGYALYKVLADIFPVEDLYLLQPPRGEFHFFEPSLSQWKLLQTAKMVVVVGTEPWINRLYTLRKDKPIFSLCKKGERLKDPHLWFDLKRISRLLERLIACIKKDNGFKIKEVLKRYEKFKERLKKLEEERKFDNCRYKKIFLLGHPVFYYLFKGTDIKEIALVKGHYHEGEPSLRTLLSMIEEVKKRDKKVVFLTDPEFIRYKELFKRQGIEVEELWSGDTMEKGDFFELLEKDLKKIRESLECKE